MVATCDFCDELNGGTCNAFHRSYRGRLHSRIVIASRNFVVMPSNGQLTEGHLLIIPVAHRLSFGHLDKRELHEAESLTNRVRIMLTTSYSAPIYFEHGCTEEHGGCGIYHAHLHAVPVEHDLTILDRLATAFNSRKIEDLVELRDRIVAGKPYLLYERQTGARCMYEVATLPSQFMRRLVAEELGHDRWDWRTVGYEPMLVSSVEKLEAAAAAL